MTASVALLCPDCPTVRAAHALVLADGARILIGVVPFVVIAAVLYAISRRVSPLTTAAMVLGVGLGGFLDGIVLHQILQWHNMMSSVVATTDLVGAKYNMVWDGLFHSLTWVTTALGVVLLFRAARRREHTWRGRVLGGGLLAGWGLFNLVEGLWDHQLLGVHHVRPGEHWLLWDLGFLAIGGVLFLVVGGLLARGGREHEHLAATTL